MTLKCENSWIDASRCYQPIISYYDVYLTNHRALNRSPVTTRISHGWSIMWCYDKIFRVNSDPPQNSERENTNHILKRFLFCKFSIEFKIFLGIDWNDQDFPMILTRFPRVAVSKSISVAVLRNFRWAFFRPMGGRVGWTLTNQKPWNGLFPV